MDDSETYMINKPTKSGSQDPSRDHLTSTYTELNIREPEGLINTETDALDPTYSQLNLRHNGIHIAKDEDPTIASGPGEMPVTAQSAAKEQKSEVKIGNRPYCLICILGVVTSALIVTVAVLSLHDGSFDDYSEARKELKKMLIGARNGHEKLLASRVKENHKPFFDYVKNKRMTRVKHLHFRSIEV